MSGNNELETVETMIRLLNQCYMIYRKSKDYDEAMITLQDLDIVKKERDKILAARETKEKQTT